jgi:hypothetical protein
VLPLGKTFTGEEFPLTGSLSGFSNEDEFGFLGSSLFNSLLKSRSPFTSSLLGLIGTLFPVGVLPSEN